MTRKQIALDNYRKALEKCNYPEIFVNDKVGKLSKTTIKNISNETKSVIALHNKECAINEREKYFETEDGANLKRECEEDLKRLEGMIEDERIKQFETINTKFHELLPNIAPYKVSYYDKQDNGYAYLKLDHPDHNFLALEIRTYNGKHIMGMASIGSFEIGKIGPETDYYVVGGLIYSNSEIVKEIMEFASNYDTSFLDELYKTRKNVIKWLNNPLHSEFIQ